MSNVESFTPRWASPPGHTIQALLRRNDIDVQTFASRLGTSRSLADGLLDGREPITVDIATRLSVTLGATKEFWVSRDCQYRDDLARVDLDDWLRDLPVTEMTRLGWIAPARDWSARAAECLSFFGVTDLPSWRDIYGSMMSSAHMRISYAHPSKQPAVAAWLRKATLDARASTTATWNPDTLRQSLLPIRALTRVTSPSVFVPQLRAILATAGVALVLVPGISGCPASGATRFLAKDKAVLVVSGRFLSDDQLWFTIFHEIGHLLLHGASQIFLDEPGESDDSPEEEAANSFAAQLLLPTELLDKVPQGRITYREAIRLAHAAGVSPGIVVGQLQFSGRVERHQLNKAKRRYKWRGSSLEMADTD